MNFGARPTVPQVFRPCHSQANRVGRVLAHDEVPPDDFVVTVHAAVADFGFHAEPTFRFGRPEPDADPLRRLTDPIEVNGVPMGRPIDMSPEAATQ